MALVPRVLFDMRHDLRACIGRGVEPARRVADTFGCLAHTCKVVRDIGIDCRLALQYCKSLFNSGGFIELRNDVVIDPEISVGLQPSSELLGDLY